VHELEELPLRVLPGEVGVALREPGLRERRHHRRPRERLREEDHLGRAAADVGDQPLPERDRLRVRVVDAEDVDAVVDPVLDDVAERVPEATPVLAVEVDVVDVLVALGRILRVLERSVRAAVEPLRMLLQPRVVGRALDREVEGDLDAHLAAALDEPVEVVDRAERRIDRVVAAELGADRPRAARVALLRAQRVVLPLSVRRPDRVDRREIDDVEAELGELRQDVEQAFEPAPRAREELVPRAEPRALPVDVELERLGERRDAGAVAALELEPLLDRQLLAAEEDRALGELAGEVLLPRLDLAAEFTDPRRFPVDPRLDRVLPPAAGVGLERARPAVVPERTHRGVAPAPLFRRAVAQRRHEHVVSVAEDRGPDVDRVADRPLRRVAAAVDDRPHVLDLDPRRRGLGGGSHRGRLSALSGS